MEKEPVSSAFKIWKNKVGPLTANEDKLLLSEMDKMNVNENGISNRSINLEPD